MKTETQITASLVYALRNECQAMVLNIHGNAYQSSGWPDLYVCHWKFKAFIECKGKNTKVEPLQIKIMTDLINRNESVYILRFTNPKEYKLLSAPYEKELIITLYGTPTEVAWRLAIEISKHQKLQSNHL